MSSVRGQVDGIRSNDRNLFTGLLGLVGATKECRVNLGKDDSAGKTDGLNWGVNAEGKV